MRVEADKILSQSMLGRVGDSGYKGRAERNVTSYQVYCNVSFHVPIVRLKRGNDPRPAPRICASSEFFTGNARSLSFVARIGATMCAMRNHRTGNPLGVEANVSSNLKGPTDSEIT